MKGLWIAGEILALSLSSGQKNLLACICFRASINDGICRDTNDKLSAFIGVHKMTVSRDVKVLHDLKYVVADEGKCRGNKRTIVPDDAWLNLYGEPISKTLTVTAGTISETLIDSTQNAYSPPEPEEAKVMPLPVVIPADILMVGTSTVAVKPEPKKKASAKPAPAPPPDLPPPDLPFSGSAFAEAWNDWLTYRKEKKKPPYKPTGLKATLSYLSNLAEGKEETAIQIIRYAMQRNWEGFFAIKDQPSAQPNQSLSTQHKPDVIRTEYRKQSFRKSGSR